MLRTAFALGLMIAAAPALAGDRALLNVIGFSDDGRFFAFEEFGRQDGSGFPYSNIYVIDVINDDWVGPPARVLIENEETGIAAARAEALAMAAPQIAETGIGYPADIIAMQADGEGSDGTSLTFARPGYLDGDTIEQSYTLTLSTFPAQSPRPCETYATEETKGFEITLDDSRGTSVLHKDADTIPGSRGCAWAYRIYAVAVPLYHEPWKGVAIVSVYSHGYEGPDRRFIAVPLAN